jgi:hypothetical protein
VNRPVQSPCDNGPCTKRCTTAYAPYGENRDVCALPVHVARWPRCEFYNKAKESSRRWPSLWHVACCSLLLQPRCLCLSSTDSEQPCAQQQPAGSAGQQLCCSVAVAPVLRDCCERFGPWFVSCRVFRCIVFVSEAHHLLRPHAA